jgi:Uma2 family endonuclease
MPRVVAAADWSTGPQGRWLACARLESGRFILESSEPVGEPSALMMRLRERASGSALVGFDFPIGLPRAYAVRAGLSSFRDALMRFGTGEWHRFYDVTDQPTLRQPFGPASNPKNGLSRLQLAQALGFESEASLLRKCEQETNAEILFFTRFPKQVGKAAIHGWRHVVTPALQEGVAVLWPFDGALEALLGDGNKVVLAEIYPSDATKQLALQLTGPKAKAGSRLLACGRLLDLAADAGIAVSRDLAAQLKAGCRNDNEFDALSALLGMLFVVLGRLPEATPQDDAVTAVEGWILGLSADGLNDAAPTPRGHLLSMRTRRATEDDLRAASRDDGKHELVDGRIIAVSPAGGRHGRVCANLVTALGSFVRDNRRGQVLDSSAGFRLPSGNVRAPDVTFVSAERLASHPLSDDFCDAAPDLAVEVLSPGDRPRAVLDKVGEYLESGVRLVWVIDPANARAQVYRSPSAGSERSGDEALDGEDVLPGFRCRLSEIL